MVSNIVQNDRTGQRFDPLVYRPFQQQPARSCGCSREHASRQGVSPRRFSDDIEAIDADLLVGPGATPLRLHWTSCSDNYWSNSVNGMLFLIFAAIALLLASVGLYAVVAHSVINARRKSASGRRWAPPPAIFSRSCCRQGMLPVGIGLLHRSPAALAVTPDPQVATRQRLTDGPSHFLRRFRRVDPVRDPGLLDSRTPRHARRPCGRVET